MTTPTTNLTMTNIKTEFGGPSPIKMSNYYRGGTYVPTGTATSPVDGTPIATSGTIRMGEFRGVSATTNINLTISSNTANYNIYTAAGSPTGPANVTLTINSGILVGTNFTGNSTAVLDTGAGWASGTTISIVNNGSIIGSGGFAASAGSGGANSPGAVGGDGGPAINAQVAISITNNGIIAGAGGGGGAGAQGNGGGAAGGQGTGAGTQVGPALQAAQGGSGGVSVGGTAGAAASGPEVFGGNATNATGTLNGQGGGGGGYGAPGGKGGNTITPALAGGFGGSGGAFVNGSSNVTWVSTGTRYGSIDTGHFTLLSGDGANVTGTSTVASGSGVAATVTVSFTSSGTGGINGTKSSNARNLWSNKATTATLPGASAWVRGTLQSGTTPSGSALNTWIPLTAAVSWAWSSPASTAGTSTGTIKVELSTASSGTPIVSSATYVATAIHS